MDIVASTDGRAGAGASERGRTPADHITPSHADEEDVRSERDLSSASEPSLSPLRVAAVIGAVVAVLLVVLAFSLSPLVGAIVLIASPVLPLVLVVATDRIRRD